MTDLPGKHTLTLEEEAGLFCLFETGKTSVEIARLTDLPLRVVAWRRAQLGYHRVKMVWTPAMDRVLSEMRDDGRTIREIRLALGVSRTAVYERLIKTGIATRSNAEADVAHRRLLRVLRDIGESVASDPRADRSAETIAFAALLRVLEHPSLTLTLRTA